jgi:4-amino-4-deoxy-L-arabinose transferase-like glycosyltransferase
MCALGALAPLLVRALGARLFSPSVGRVAAWLTAVHPLLVFFSGYLLTEAMFTDALLVGLLASVAWVSRPSPRAAFVAGLAWGVAALTRPTALPMPVLVALWAWLPLGLQLRSRARLAQLALLLVGTLAVVGPWTLRNARELGALIPVTTGGGRSLLDANNAVVWDDPARRGGASAVLTTEPWATRFRGLSEVELDRAAGAEARAFLRERAAQWPAMALAKLGRLWRLGASTPTTGSWGGGLAARLQALDPLQWWSLLFLPLAAVGAGLALRGPRRLHQSLPLLVVAAFSLGTTVYWGALRLRVPLEPLLALFAAHALHEGWRRLRARRAGLSLVPPAA